MYKVEKARIGDVGRMQELINGFAAREEMLPRSLSEIYENIRDYFVVRDQDRVVGCGALHVCWADMAEVRSIAANMGAFEDEIVELEAELASALRQLPNEKQLEVLLADISNLGKTAGVQIRSFERQNEVVHDFYAEVPLRIKLDGTFHEIARFFDLVSKLPRIVNMGALDMKIARETEQETELTVDGVATTFRFVGEG